MSVSEDELTHDTLLRGRVKIIQPARGYRFSLDPVLLGGFAQPPYGRFVDIGCGTGALAFLLLARDPEARGLGIEIQPRLAALAARAAAENGFEGRFRLVAGDVRSRDWAAEPLFDLVVTNPPFRPVGAGVLSPDGERQLAHHEVTLTLAAWLDAAAAALAPGGRLAAIYPPARLAELRAGLLERGFSVSRLRLVLPRAGEAPRRVLVEAIRGPAIVSSEPPLVVHDVGGAGFTPEVRRMLGEE